MPGEEEAAQETKENEPSGSPEQAGGVTTTPEPGTVLIVYLLMSIYLRTPATEPVNQTLGELLV